MQSRYTKPDPSRSVLLTIDVQRDFSDPGAPAEISGTMQCIPAMRRILEAYRLYRLPIVHVVRLYLPDGANADLCRKETIEHGRAVVVPNSVGAELVDPLKPMGGVRLDAEVLLASEFQEIAPSEWIMYKPRWDAFHVTPLDRFLRKIKVTTVVVVGCNFPNCPRATVYGASMRDFRTVLIADAVSGVYDRGLTELNAIGVSTPTTEQYEAVLAASMAGAPAGSPVDGQPGETVELPT